MHILFLSVGIVMGGVTYPLGEEPQSLARGLRSTPSGHKPSMHPEGRRCFRCGVRLSCYNPGPACFAHRSFETKRVRGRVRLGRGSEEGP